MAVRLECRRRRPVGLWIKVSCESAERNSLAIKSEHSRSAARVRRMNRRSNKLAAYAGPLTTGSGGTTAASLQGGTPPNM